MNDHAPPALDTDRLRVGRCTVTLSSREVQVPGIRRVRRLTPKAVSVLVVLARNPGRVVTRDELFAEVWPDTLPTNDVLTQAVTQLRKAFAGEADDDSPYIETIARTGYRLLAPVTALDVQAEAAPDVAVAAAPVAADGVDAAGAPGAAAASSSLRTRWRRVRRRLLLVLGLAMACALVVMGWQLQSRVPRSPLDAAIGDGTRVIGSPPRPYRLITTTSGFETWPSLSPDGSQVAYESNTREGEGGRIQVQTSSNAPARALVERPDGASDRFPTWSPDGRDISFARFFADGRCEVLIASATGGNLRHATRCDGTELLSFDWTPDGHGLVFGSMTGRHAHAGIRVLELASGAWRALDYPTRPDDFDYAPRYSPDGRWLAFVRNPQVGDLWRMPADGGEPEQLTDDAAEIRGWAWLGGGDAIVFGRSVDSEVRLYRLDIETRLLRDLGVDDGEWPSVARTAGTLAFVQRKAQFGLFEFALDPAVPGLQAPRPAGRLFASSGRDSQPTLSPDGHQIVFASDRSGSYALWWADLQRPDSLRPLQGVRPDTRQAPVWSPDGRRVLVVGRDAQGAPRVYEVSPQDEQATVLDVPAVRPLQALYTNDPARLLLVERDDQQRTRLVLYDRSQRPWRRLGVLEGVSQARFDRLRQRVLFTRFGAGGLWQADAMLSASSIAVVSEDRPSRWRYRTWAVARDGGIQYLESSVACSTVLTRINGPAAVDSRCLDSERLSTGNGFGVSAAGNRVVIPLAVVDGTDIGLMEVPETPVPGVSGVIKLLRTNEK